MSTFTILFLSVSKKTNTCCHINDVWSCPGNAKNFAADWNMKSFRWYVTIKIGNVVDIKGKTIFFMKQLNSKFSFWTPNERYKNDALQGLCFPSWVSSHRDTYQWNCFQAHLVNSPYINLKRFENIRAFSRSCFLYWNKFDIKSTGSGPLGISTNWLKKHTTRSKVTIV